MDAFTENLSHLVPVNFNTGHNIMDQERYLSDSELADRFGIARTSVWRWVRTAPDFPKPLKLSAGCTRWKASEIATWEASRDAAA